MNYLLLPSATKSSVLLKKKYNHSKQIGETKQYLHSRNDENIDY